MSIAVPPNWAILVKTTRGEQPAMILDGRVWTSIVKYHGEPTRACKSSDLLPRPKKFHMGFLADVADPRHWLLKVPDEFRSDVLVNKNPVSNDLHMLVDGDNISIRRSRQESFTIFLMHQFFHYYRLGCFLGHGPLSTFYTCSRRANPGDLFTVKIIRHSHCSWPPEGRLYDAAMRRDCATLTALHEAGGHENILRLFDAYIGPTATYIITETITQNLRHFLGDKNGQLAIYEFLPIIRGMCRGMKFVHEHNAIHRNLTLENVVLCGHVAKITGFEAAESPNFHDTGLWEHIVSAPYMAPELRYGRPYDNKIDCWSFGIIVQALLAGLPVMDRFLENEVIALGLPNWCTELVRKLLSQNPQDRSSMEDVWEFLQTI